ncbi:MAG: tetratricopeptide repeat protein [Fimbriimonadaceae bacterium]|nr:tetratricopeptide repeat protein [Fimbriimonadaceae bacterium]
MSEDHGKQFREEAIQSVQSGQPEKALELINQALELNDHDSEAYVLKGIALAQLKRDDEATEAFRGAISCGPSNPKAYFNLAVHQYGLGHKAEAESIAREAVRLDPSHSGAKDLVARITREMNPDVITPTGKVAADAPSLSQPGDPLSQPNPGAAPPTGQPSGPPAGAPPQGQPGLHGPGTPPPGQQYIPPGGYERPGYGTRNVHSMAFIENMGKGWDGFGYILSALNIILFIVISAATYSLVMEAFQNPEAFQNRNMGFFSMEGVSPVITVLSLVSRLIQLISLIWMIMELADRRGNWLWLLPFILCCCCGLPGLIIPIYIWKGRS